MCFKYVHETRTFAFPSIWPWAAMISVLHVLLPLCAHPQGLGVTRAGLYCGKPKNPLQDRRRLSLGFRWKLITLGGQKKVILLVSLLFLLDLTNQFKWIEAFGVNQYLYSPLSVTKLLSWKILVHGKGSQFRFTIYSLACILRLNKLHTSVLKRSFL